MDTETLLKRLGWRRVTPDQAQRINELKAQAGTAYLRFCDISDGCDCGNTMLKEINPTAAKYARIYNEALEELRRIDPACPDFSPL